MKIGVVSDTHFPAEHPGALDFVCDIFEAWDIDRIVHIGDVADLHGPSFHEKNPSMPGPLDEYLMAKEKVQQWRDRFIKAGWVTMNKPVLVCEGNHCDRGKRVADSCGLASDFIRSHEDVWDTPDWRWDINHIVDDVLYAHGHKGCGGGKNPALRTLELGMDLPVVMGHYHSVGGVAPLAGMRTLRWGMNVGCLVDRLHPAMKYYQGGKKPILSCGVVIDGHPYYELMPCGAGEKYHRSKFTKKGRA